MGPSSPAQSLSTRPPPTRLRAPTPLKSTPLCWQDNLADALFGIETTSTLTCDEAPDEPPIVQREAQRRLACHLKQGCAHLYNAIELSLDEAVSKMSPSLGREANLSLIHI